MKSDHAATRIKTGKIAQDRNMAAWYRHQDILNQLDTNKRYDKFDELIRYSAWLKRQNLLRKLQNGDKLKISERNKIMESAKKYNELILKIDQERIKQMEAEQK